MKGVCGREERKAYISGHHLMWNEKQEEPTLLHRPDSYKGRPSHDT